MPDKNQEIINLLKNFITKKELLDFTKSIFAVIAEIKQKNDDAMNNFLLSFKEISGIVDRIKIENKGYISKLETFFEDTLTRNKTNLDNDLKDFITKSNDFLRTQIQELWNKYNLRIIAIEDKVNNILQGKEGEPGRDGKDGKDGSPDTAEQILEKIDGLLEIEDIKGLKEIIEELRKIRSVRLGGGGGFSYIAMDQHFIDDEVPSGTVDGSNAIFTLDFAPNPIASLKVYVNGQKMKAGGTDYTLSGKTITFVTAPPTNSIILCDYRK